MSVSAVPPVLKEFSPVTFNQSWPKLTRLLVAIAVSCVGAVMNCFFIAAFFVEDALKRIGNVFLACAGLADLLVSGLVVPTTAVVLLSGQWDILEVCYALQFLTQASTYAYSLFFTLVATETYYRLCRSTDEYDAFISMRVGAVAFVVFLTAFTTAAIGVYMELDYDYCTRSHFGSFNYRLTTDLTFHVIPFFYIMMCFLRAMISMRRRVKEQTHYRRSQQYQNDRSSTSLNITAYLLYSFAWFPYLFVVYEDPAASDARFYQSVWFGISRSVLSSFLYGILERSFRKGFAYLFNYCCFKSTLSGSFVGRHRRNYEYKPPACEVRVHIMQSGVNSNSPQRGTSSIRETQEL